MTDKEIKNQVNSFVKENTLREVTFDNLSEAIQKEGYTVVEFKPNSTDEDVEILIDSLNIRKYLTNTRGFTFANGNYRLIFVDERLAIKEKLVVLAHEIGHIKCGHMGKVYVLGQDVIEEYEANKFAGYLLNEKSGMNKKILFATAGIIAAGTTAIYAAVEIINNNENKEPQVTFEASLMADEETTIAEPTEAEETSVIETLPTATEIETTTEVESTECAETSSETTEEETTLEEDTSEELTTEEITTEEETESTEAPTTVAPTTVAPTTEPPTTETPTTEAPTTEAPTTEAPATEPETTAMDPDFIVNRGILVGYKGEGGCVVIPDGIYMISNDVFSGNDAITELVIPSSVKIIEWQAFKGLGNLKKVTAAASIDWYSNGPYGFETFKDCNNLEEIVYTLGVNDFTNAVPADNSTVKTIKLQEGIHRVPVRCFENYAGTSVELPSSIREIGYEAFKNCTNLTSITIPDGVTVLDVDTFPGCTALESVTMPASIVAIDEWAFRDNSISHITYGGTKNRWDLILQKPGLFPLATIDCVGATDEFVVDAGGVLRAYNGEGGDVVLPSSVKAIGEAAFYGCDKIATLTIPEGVSSIGDFAFGRCTGMYSITIPSTVKSIGYNAFTATTKLYYLSLPEGVEYIGRSILGDSYARVSVGSVFSAVRELYLPASLKRAEGFLYTPDIYFAGSESAWKEFDVLTPQSTLHFGS